MCVALKVKFHIKDETLSLVKVVTDIIYIYIFIYIYIYKLTTKTQRKFN